MDVFKKYPKLDRYYETSDGMKFFRENDARNHAKTLDDKSVKTVVKPVKDAGTDAKGGKKDEEPVKDTGANAKDGEKDIEPVKDAGTDAKGGKITKKTTKK